MGGISEESIRRRAYQIWEREGRPHGRDFDHWVRAQVELATEPPKNGDGRRIAPVRAAAPKSKAAAAKRRRPASSRAGRAKRPA